LRSTTAFVGREKERELLRRCLQAVKSGQGRIVIIAGPPGIGKTRTAREAGDEARQQGFVALAGNCYDREDSVPFVPFVEVLEVVLARASGAAAIGEILGDQAAELSRLLPQVRRLFPDLPMPMQASPEQSRRLLFNAAVELIGRQSALNPLLLLLEDLHWADEGTLSLLVHLARAISTLPVMIIATHRNDDVDMKPLLTKALDELMRLGVVEQIKLDGLPERDVAEMIELLSGHEPSPVLVDLIYSNTDGNPLFVEELIRDLDQNQSNGDFVERLQQGEVALPHSLRLVIGRRLALVSKESARVLGTAAVIGRSFNFGLLEAASHIEPDGLVDSLEEAEKAGLVTSRLEYPEARFKFSHELIRRAVLDEISVARRQRVHLNIAEAMEQLYGSSLEEHAEDLAHHFWSAGAAADPVKAIRYLQTAGEKAVRSSANVEAIGHYTKALELLKTAPGIADRTEKELGLQLGLGVPLALTRGYSAPEVEAIYNRARELSLHAGDSPRVFSLVLGLKRFYLFRGDLQTALELGRRLLTLARGRADRSLLTRANLMQGQTLYTLGDLVQAQRYFEEGNALYDCHEERPYVALYGIDSGVGCLSYEAIIQWFLGYPDGALGPSQRALALARELDHPFNLAMTLTWAAFLRHLRREDETSLEYADEVVKLATKHQFVLWLAWGLILRGCALIRIGHKQEIGQIQRGLELWRSTGALGVIHQMLTLLADSHLTLRQTTEGLNAVSDAFASAEKTGERLFEAELYRIKAELLQQLRPSGRYEFPSSEGAEAYLLKAVDTARRQGAKSIELRSLTSLTRLLRQRPERKHQSGQLLAGTYRWFSEGLDTADLKEARALLEELRRD
jgi:predicted ATPase